MSTIDTQENVFLVKPKNEVKYNIINNQVDAGFITELKLEFDNRGIKLLSAYVYAYAEFDVDYNGLTASAKDYMFAALVIEYGYTKFIFSNALTLALNGKILYRNYFSYSEEIVTSIQSGLFSVSDIIKPIDIKLDKLDSIDIEYFAKQYKNSFPKLDSEFVLIINGEKKYFILNNLVLPLPYELVKENNKKSHSVNLFELVLFYYATLAELDEPNKIFNLLHTKVESLDISAYPDDIHFEYINTENMFWFHKKSKTSFNWYPKTSVRDFKRTNS